MVTRTWRTLIVVAGIAVVAVTTGTAVMAAIDDNDDPPAVRQAADAAPDGEAQDGGNTVAAICIEGAEDCDDTIDSGGGAAGTCLEGTTDCIDTPGIGGFEQCATDAPCGDFDARCAAGSACIEPWLMHPPVCPDGVAFEECFPDGVPAGYECVQLESFPVQTKCYYAGCPIDDPISILPAPGEPIDVDEPAEESVIEPVDPELADPGIAIGEPVPASPVHCLPPVDCNVDPTPDECLGSECGISSRVPVRCLPPECTTLEDGTVACKVPPPVECGPNELCLPPDCAISSDGLTYCPDKPLPCDEIQADGGCSSPGSCGSLGCDPVVCPDDVTDEECARIHREMRENTGGSGTEGSVE